MSTGFLYIVSTPIGNPGDITLRAIQTLNEVGHVVCEERKEGSRLLKRLDISKPLYPLNEHNEAETVPELIQLLKNGESLAVISDCGTPVFADPGTLLVQAAVAAKIQVVPVPGSSSLMAALVVSALDLKEFHYAGFLPRQSDQRCSKLKQLQTIRTPLVIYEAPYRLLPLLKDLLEVFGKQTAAVLCIDLTQPEERIYHQTLGKLHEMFTQDPVKAEFVVMIDNRKSGGSPSRSRKSPRQHRRQHTVLKKR